MDDGPLGGEAVVVTDVIEGLLPLELLRAEQALHRQLGLRVDHLARE